MKETRLLMGMPITVEVVDGSVRQEDLDEVFAYFGSVDGRFSTYKDTSEISKINRGELLPDEYSEDMRTILALSEQTKEETDGYFNIERDGMLDPSGIVKGWAIQQVANLLQARGFYNFYVDAGGDVQVVGTKDGHPWRVGIRDPRAPDTLLGSLPLARGFVVSSGDYERRFERAGVRYSHILDPRTGRSARGPRGVTLASPRLEDVAGYGVAIMVLGVEEAKRLVRERPQLDALVAGREGGLWMSPGMRERLQFR